MKHVEQVVTALIRNDARSATKYVSDKQIVRATRRTFRGHYPRATSNVDIVLTLGRPNYRERAFIKQCKKAGEPMPVKKVQLRMMPKRKSARA